MEIRFWSAVCPNGAPLLAPEIETQPHSAVEKNTSNQFKTTKQWIDLLCHMVDWANTKTNIIKAYQSFATYTHTNGHV